MANTTKINNIPKDKLPVVRFPKTILIIEDNLQIRENVTELLEIEGYKVIAAENGSRGLVLAKENLPDLVICDIVMPEFNGYDVLHQLKKDPNTSSILFIFVTAKAEKKERQAAIHMGADKYIVKPFDVDELLAEIIDCLEK